ncbi:MAG: HD domain-containing protein [Eubacteriales bacterium]|nr:HD domain-containing protein [Eubacteriales bacterium]
MAIINLKEASEVDRISEGAVLINEEPVLRQGKHKPFMIGTFIGPDGNSEFRIWEEQIYQSVVENGTGIYDASVVGSEYNGNYYLTVRRIRPTLEDGLERSDFLPQIPKLQIKKHWQEANLALKEQGLTESAMFIAKEILNDPEVVSRFFVEGAAIYHHDNKIGGLANHSFKMLRILAAVIANLPALRKSCDLLYLGVLLHDIGKIHEYDNLAPSEFWYANHRVRGIEFLTKYKELIVERYDEAFYRQLQAIIIGHHGEYGDRPTTVATGIVHYIDTLESQVTGLLEKQRDTPGVKIRNEWGFLEAIPLDDEFYFEEEAIER